jgi:arylformamidase
LLSTQGKEKSQFQIREIIDLSVPMTSLDTPVYPGYPQPLRSNFTTIRDNGYFSSIWIFAEHSSTHVDGPAHFEEGAPTIDRVRLERYVGRGFVLDFTGKPQEYSITREDVKSRLGGQKVGDGWILLFHTGYSEKSHTDVWLKHPRLSEDACNYIVELGVNGIGFDAPGPDGPPFPAHRILLPKQLSNYENLTNLDKVAGKDFIFVGTPLRLTDGSASPVRAVALVF